MIFPDGNAYKRHKVSQRENLCGALPDHISCEERTNSANRLKLVSIFSALVPHRPLSASSEAYFQNPPTFQ